MGNVSVGTALGHGLADPKVTVKSLYLVRFLTVREKREGFFGSLVSIFVLRNRGRDWVNLGEFSL